MSATNRGAERRPDDFYETPQWCVDRLLDRVSLPTGHWLEPSCGAGAIIRAVSRREAPTWTPQWTAVDLHPQMPGAVEADFLTWLPPPRLRFRVCLGNPPFSMALPFAKKCRDLADITILLLRLNWLASAERAAWLQRNPPSVFVLPNRPSFTGNGTDATDYGWIAWGLHPSHRIEILNETPIEERRRVGWD
jgi:hypothetical protein